MGSYKRVLSIFSKAINVFVILLSFAQIIVFWIVQDNLTSSAVAIFSKVDNVAQSMRSGITRIEPELLALRDLIDQVETASEEIAQNVSDDGVILRLLPQSVVDGLTTSSQSLRDNFIAVYDLLGAASDVLLALDTIPFVEVPERGLSTVATLKEDMEEISEKVDSLKTNIVDLRLEAGERIAGISDAAAFLGEETEQFHSDLSQIDRELDNIQTKVKRNQRLTPPLIFTTAIIMSLVSAWVVYSQVVMISRSKTPDHGKKTGSGENIPQSIDDGHNA